MVPDQPALPEHVTALLQRGRMALEDPDQSCCRRGRESRGRGEVLGFRQWVRLWLREWWGRTPFGHEPERRVQITPRLPRWAWHGHPAMHGAPCMVRPRPPAWRRADPPLLLVRGGLWRKVLEDLGLLEQELQPVFVPLVLRGKGRESFVRPVEPLQTFDLSLVPRSSPRTARPAFAAALDAPSSAWPSGEGAPSPARRSHAWSQARHHPAPIPPFAEHAAMPNGR